MIPDLLRKHRRVPRLHAERGTAPGSSRRMVAALAGLAAAVLGCTLPAHAQHATGGAGAYRSNILWFSWGTHGQNIPQSGLTVTNDYDVGGQLLEVTCSLDQIASPGADPDLSVYRPGSFAADGLDDLYNIGGVGAANTLHTGIANRVGAQTVDFRFSCSATLGGAPYTLGGLVFSDAETNSAAESIRVTIPDGSTFRVIERLRSGCSAPYAIIASGNTYTTSTPSDYCVGGSGPMVVGFIDGATTGTVRLVGGGRTAVALGVMVYGSDYGDAPASYGPAGHLLQSSFTGGTVAPGAATNVFAPEFNLAALRAPALHLGVRADAELAHQPTADANGDDNSGSRDEDGLVPGSVELVAGATTARVVLQAANQGAGAATLAGWIDFDGNGSFDADERVQVTVPAGTPAGTAFELEWTGLSPIPAGFRGAARFRIAGSEAEVLTPNGLASDGEVEDYMLPFVEPVLSCSSDPSVFNTAYDGAGGSLPPGGVDTFWQAGLGTPAGPGSVSTWSPAFVVGQAAPAWTPSPFGNAEWISFYPDATHTGQVDHYYRYRFTLDNAVDPAQFALAIDFYVDNSVWEVYVNGQPQSALLPPGTLPQDPVNPYFYNGFVVGAQASLNLASGWQSGANELVVHVRSGAPLVGLLGQVTASPLCPGAIAIDKQLSAEDGSVPGQAEPGERLTYTITLTNDSSVDASGFELVDALDDNVVFVSADNGGVHDGAATGGEVRWAALTIPGGGSLVLTVTSEVLAPLPAGVTRIGNVAYNPVVGPPDCDAVPMTAGCVYVPLADPLDFGDAPDSYGTLLASDGARHAVAGFDAASGTASLMIGARVDVESDGAPGAGASGDDMAGADDEDAAGTLAPMALSQDSYVLNVPLRNDTGAAAVLVGWIDWNRNGTFEPAEGVSAPVAAGATEATLAWNGVDAGLVPGATHVRLRIAPAGQITTGTPVGPAIGGEVEDHLLQIVELPDAFGSCPVNDLPPPSDFTIRERWSTEGTGTYAYQTPVVGDLFGDGQPVIVIGANDGHTAGNPTTGRTARNVRLYRGIDGTLIDTIETPDYSWSGNSAVALADVDGDGQGEILFKVAGHTAPAGEQGRLIAYRNDGSVMWVSDERYDYGQSRGGLSINVADFNGDGIPEAYVGNQIFNARTGVRLLAATAAASAGCTATAAPNPCFWGNSVAADMDGDGVLELVAGDVIYKVDIANPASAAGNSLSVWRQAAAGPGVGDGFTAVADVDLDGDADVIVVRAAVETGPTAMFVWEGQTDEVLGAVTGMGTSGSQPFLGDMDGDGRPEIAFSTSNRLHAYTYVPGTGLALKWSLVATDSSGYTSLSMFDFNNDGQREIVYRDETDIRIIDGSGAAPVDLATFPCQSGTATDMPVIADIDGSRQARILVTCGTTDISQGAVRAYESASFPWANTRPVWNQQAYFVAHVNNDLTIPSAQFPHWTAFDDPGALCSGGTNRPLNAFQQQVTDLDPATGCPAVCAPAAVTVTKALTGESGNADGVAEPGEQLTYTITLTNTGGANAVGYAVTDQLDPNVSFVSASNGGTLSGTQVQWSGLVVPANGTLVLTVVVEVADPLPPGVAQIGNVAYETGTTPPDCTATPMPENCTTTPTAPSVSLAKALTGESGDADGVAEPGEQLTYTITLTNTGGSDATGFGVTDQLDANVSFVSADNGGSHAGGVVTWTGLTVPANGTLTLTVVVAVNDPLPAGVTQIANVAFETGTTPPPCPPAGGQCVIVPTIGNVTIAKALADESGAVDGAAEPGEQLTYTITLTNTGGSDVTGYGVTDQLDENVSFVSADNGGSHAGGAVTWTNLTVPANGMLTLTVVVAVNDPLPAGVTQIANVAFETGTTPPACPPAGGQCVTVPTIGNVTIAKALTGENGAVDGAAEPGEQLTYTITLTNTGGSDVTGYGVTDQLDANVTFVSASNGGSNTAGVVTWTNLTVPANGTLTLTVVVAVNDPLPAGVTQIANVAFETGTTPPPCPPAGEQCVIVPTIGSVTIAKALTGENGEVDGVAEPGEQLTYTITLTNTGGSDVTGYGVTDQLDENVSFVSASNGGSNAAGVVTWTNLAVPANGTLTLTVVVAVNDPLPEGVEQIANVAFETGTTPPACPPAGSQCVITPTIGSVTIAKALTGENGEVDGIAEPGEQLTYTITLTNTGGSDVTGFGVTDQLDENVTFVSADNGGSSAGGVVTWTGLTVPANGTLTLTVVVTVNDPLPEGVEQIANVAFETGTTPPPCPPAGGQCVITPTVGSVTIAKALTGENGEVDGVAEPGEQLTYTITMTNTGGSDVTGYGVTDQLDENVTFVSASNGGSNTAGVVTWVNLTVPANGTLTLTVVVTVNDPLPEGVEQIANVAFETGTTPPACPPAGGQCVITPTIGSVTIAKALTGENGEVDGIAEPGEQLTYTITLTNTGGSDVTGYGVTDQLDENVSFVSASNGGSNTAGVVTWTGLTVPANGTLTLTVVVTVNDPLPEGVEQIANVAFETGTTPPPCPPAGGQCVITPTIGSVTIAKALTGENGEVDGIAEPGEQLTYTITLTNTGGSDVTGFGVTDQLDENVTFVSADNGGSNAGGVVTWTGLTVPANGTLTLTVVVTVNDPLPEGVEQIANVAFETGTTPPACPPAGGQCVITPTIGSVTIAKALTGENGEVDGVAEPGEQLTYTITLTNTGGSDVTGYGVTDQLDENVSFVSADNGGSNAGGVVTWSNLTVPSNASLVLTVVVQVVDDLPADVTQIGNVAFETGTAPPDCDAEPMPSNCTFIPVDPRRVVLTIEKSASPVVFNPGGTGTYTVVVTVDSDSPALTGGPVEVFDPMPVPLAISGAVSGTGWDCTQSTDAEALCVYTGPYPVAAGAQVGGAITIPFRVPAGATPSDILNIAAVTYGAEQASDEDEAVIEIVGPVPPRPPAPVPTNAPWMLWLLGLLMVAAATGRHGRRARYEE